MKKVISMVAAMLMTGVLFMGCGSQSGSETTQESTSKSDTSSSISSSSKESDSDVEDGEVLTGKHHVEIAVKDYGTIKVELDADTAPITVTNFVNLAKGGFYDGLTFHRIIDGFMIQGGDPLGNGTGGADENIKGEFAQNGVENSISHVRGTISMARSQEYDSASSQFFIVQSDSTYLDGQYAGFGTVTEGMEIVDKICQDIPVQDNNGTVSPDDQPIIESITVTD